VEQAILAQDPSLSAAPVTPGPVAPAPVAPGPAPQPVAPVPVPAAPGPGPTARWGRGNLRGPLTSFVGRKEELARLLELLGQHRLVTLTGPGGVGKTRLAVEAARRLGRGPGGGGQADGDGDAPDAVWLVELAGLADGRLVARSVLDTLGLGERPRLDSDGPQLIQSAADATGRLVAALERHRPLQPAGDGACLRHRAARRGG